MSTLYSLLNINDSDRVYVQTLGQGLVLDAITEIVARNNSEMNAAMSIFIEKTTEDFQDRYKLPGGGRMSERDTMTPGHAVKATGGWDVAWPLKDYGEQIGGDDVEMAHMLISDLQRHLSTILIRNADRVRHEILFALFNNTQRTVIDRRGTLLIEPLANNDTVVYPPVIGSNTEATENHYLASGYLPANISDVNNPFPVIRKELEHHFGVATGGARVVNYVNSTHTEQISENITNHREVVDRFIDPGDDTDRPVNFPMVPSTARIVGRVSGTWHVEWDWIPENYILSIHEEAPKPLVMRVDPVDTGLARGLTLVARNETYPLEQSFWRHRFGIGAGNRVNGVVMHLTAGAYTIPTGYS
jgi:hypothetical protein